MIDSKFIKGEFHRKYYEKHKSLPTYFDSLGRMPFNYREKVLKEALDNNKTWQQVTGQKHNDLI